MAGYKAHIIFGILFAGLFAFLSYRYAIIEFNVISLLLAIPILFIYSMLPDIDISTSKISKIVMILGLLSIIALIIFDKKILAVSICVILLLLQIIKHRKFIHTIAAGVLLSAPLIYFNYIVAIFAFVAYFSHLLLDGQVKLK